MATTLAAASMLLKKETWSSLLAADSLLGATANMINTIIGGGTLSLPYAISRSVPA